MKKHLTLLLASLALVACQDGDTLLETGTSSHLRDRLSRNLEQWTHPKSGCVYNILAYARGHGGYSVVFLDTRADGTPNCPDAPAAKDARDE